ncbi:MAG: LysR family transcriptional regulator [Rhizobiales bacterium]|nr:LysR family transcriptional regulator [Hyphomicrobiales bacterium]
MKPSFTNIPMEIIRTFVAVADTGSISKAADKMGLSQPAVSSQMKRLQVLLGGPVLLKGGSGTIISELGKLALEKARLVIDMQDQMLMLAGGGSQYTSLRLGISALMLPTFLATGFEPSRERLFVFAEHSREIRKGLVEGYIDIGCMFTSSGDETEIADLVVERLAVPMAWVRSRDFTLSPGAPIPVISLPEDDYIIRPLKKAGISYRIALHSGDMYARHAAIRAGCGIGAVPRAVVPSDLVITEDYYLPKMHAIEAYICVRAGLDRQKVNNVMTYLLATLKTFGTG